jgi:hypothetical protein
LQLYLDAELLTALEIPAKNSVAWCKFWEDATARAKAEEGKKGHHQPASKVGDSAVSGRVECAVQARELLKSACVIVGFHPDQATEPCIDLALSMRIPFVVCPCCVFPTQFPQRMLHGRSVSSYDDFLRYLRQKHPCMRMGKLKFESKAVGDGAGQARNTVLYMLPEDYSLCSTCAGSPASSGRAGAEQQYGGQRRSGADVVGKKKGRNGRKTKTQQAVKSESSERSESSISCRV